MKINFRQLSIMVFMSFIALKFLVLPSALYLGSGNMSWLVTLVLMLIDGFYAFIIIKLMQKCNDKNILEFLNNTVGKFLAKVILVLFTLQIFLQLSNITKGMEFFVVENFYNNFNWILFSLPLVGLTSFMMYKGVRNIARVQEVFFLAVAVGCVYIAFKSMADVNPKIYFPFFKDGVLPLFESGFKHINWFGSATFLIMLFGKVDFSKKKKFQLWFYIIFSILLVQLMYFVFFGLFENTSPTHTFAISDISQYSSSKSIIDELSWLVVSLWVVAQSIQIALYGYCLVLSVMFLFNIRNKSVVVFIISFIIFGLGYVGSKTINIEQIFFMPVVSILGLITNYCIPLIMWLGYLINIKKNKKYAKVVENEKIKNPI